MLLGFKRCFAPFVEDGSKTHTIRGRRKIRPRVGQMCHCYVDPRQKTMRLLGRWPCVKVDEIRISFPDKEGFPVAVSIAINGQELSRDEVNELCWRDGFRPVRKIDAWVSFFHFWKEMHGLDAFEGDIIHWRRE